MDLFLFCFFLVGIENGFGMVHVFVVFSLVSTVLHPPVVLLSPTTRYYTAPNTYRFYRLFFILYIFIVGFFFPVVRSFVVVAVFFVLYGWLWVKV